MLQIGITGGIGSGKSIVCKIFQVLGVPVYNADLAARDLMHTDVQLVQELKATFGAQLYNAEGQLQRPVLADIVFKDAAKLAQLNALVHPAVFRDYAAWVSQQTEAPYVLKEAALIFEAGSHKQLDKVITVYSPIELRIARVLGRDHTTEAAIRDRMSKQMPDEEKKAMADHVVYNDEAHSLILQVLELHGIFAPNA